MPHTIIIKTVNCYSKQVLTYKKVKLSHAGPLGPPISVKLSHAGPLGPNRSLLDGGLVGWVKFNLSGAAKELQPCQKAAGELQARQRQCVDTDEQSRPTTAQLTKKPFGGRAGKTFWWSWACIQDIFIHGIPKFFWNVCDALRRSDAQVRNIIPYLPTFSGKMKKNILGMGEFGAAPESRVRPSQLVCSPAAAIPSHSRQDGAMFQMPTYGFEAPLVVQPNYWDSNTHYIPTHGNDFDFEKPTLVYSPPFKTISQTLRANVVTASGLKKRVRVFLDNGSQLSIISKQLMEELELRNENHVCTLAMYCSGGLKAVFPREYICHFKLESIFGDFTTELIEACSCDHVTMDIQRITTSVHTLAYLRDVRDWTDKLPMSTQYWEKNKRCLLLLGEPWASRLIRKVTTSPVVQLPSATHTYLGSLLCGAVGFSETQLNPEIERARTATYKILVYQLH